VKNRPLGTQAAPVCEGGVLAPVRLMTADCLRWRLANLLSRRATRRGAANQTGGSRDSRLALAACASWVPFRAPSQCAVDVHRQGGCRSDPAGPL